MMKMNDFIKMLESGNSEYKVCNRIDGLIGVWVINKEDDAVLFKFDKDGNFVSI